MKFHRFILPVLTILFVGFLSLPAMATDGVKAKAFIEKMGDNAVGFLEDDTLTQADKKAQFRTLLNRNFDMPTIARFALGRYWNTATNAQREVYLDLFEDMIVRVYSQRFGDYNGENFNVSGFRDTGKNDSLVTSHIITNQGSKIQVDWRVREKDGSMKVIDVIIEGVSMSLTQRSDFSSVIQRGGGNIQVLIDHLKK